MLEPAVAFAERSHQEHVSIHRCGLAEQADVPFAQRLEIAAQALEVGIVSAVDGDVVRHSARSEGCQRQLAHLDRMVDQLVVVRRTIRAEAVHRCAGPRHRGGDPPVAIARAGRAQDVDAAGALLPSQRTQEYAWTIEEGMTGVQMRTAHRQVEGIHVDRHHDGPGVGCHDPGVLVDLGYRQRLAPAARADRHHVPGEVADQIAAGDPGRQREALSIRVGIGDGAGDFEEMGLRTLRKDTVVDGRGALHAAGRLGKASILAVTAPNRSSNRRGTEAQRTRGEQHDRSATAAKPQFGTESLCASSAPLCSLRFSFGDALVICLRAGSQPPPRNQSTMW